jgi:hypothetical protein
MNTNPDEVKLALWLDDELHGEELEAFEKWVADQPGHLAAREESREWRKMMNAALPASEEPPYPDFFNSRLAKAIHELNATPAGKSAPAFSWRSWLMPVTACAGMVAAFWMGGTLKQPPPTPMVITPVSEKKPLVYLPEKGVAADWFRSEEASATVIVLQGVSAIPDSTDFFSTAYIPMQGDKDRTASNRENEDPKSVRQ